MFVKHAPTRIVLHTLFLIAAFTIIPFWLWLTLGGISVVLAGMVLFLKGASQRASDPDVTWNGDGA